MKTLAEAIVEDRERTGQSQGQVAAAIGVTQQALSEWEKGNTTPRGQRLSMLAEYFGPNSDTAHVIAHIHPRSYKHLINNALYVRAEDHKALRHGDYPVGKQTGVGAQAGSGEKQAPPGDSPEPRVNESPAAYIPSFENRAAPTVTSDVHDALTRAQHGVHLARQVLDDAAVQLARAIAQIPKK